MENLKIYYDGKELTNIKCFKIDSSEKNGKNNLEIIGEITSNLMDLANGDVSNKVIEIHFGITKLKFACSEFGGSGVKTDLRFNEIIIFYNCYGDYSVETNI